MLGLGAALASLAGADPQPQAGGTSRIRQTVAVQQAGQQQAVAPQRSGTPAAVSAARPGNPTRVKTNPVPITRLPAVDQAWAVKAAGLVWNGLEAPVFLDARRMHVENFATLRLWSPVSLNDYHYGEMKFGPSPSGDSSSCLRVALTIPAGKRALVDVLVESKPGLGQFRVWNGVGVQPDTVEGKTSGGLRHVLSVAESIGGHADVTVWNPASSWTCRGVEISPLK